LREISRRASPEEEEEETATEARPIHWSPYDRVGVVNADP
jgi:hypothetical protein